MSICFISPHNEERERANSKEENKEKCNRTTGPQIWIFLISTTFGSDILGLRVFVRVPNNHNTAVNPCNFPSLPMFYKPASLHALSRLLKSEFLEGRPLGLISGLLSGPRTAYHTYYPQYNHWVLSGSSYKCTVRISLHHILRLQ